MAVTPRDPSDPSPAPQTDPRPESPRVARRPGRVKLRILDGAQAGREVVIDRTKLRVGRGAAADVRIDDESLSGLHFELRLRPHGVELLDLASQNGTMLLGRRVFHTSVLPGDVIEAGACRIELVETGDIDVEHGLEAREDGLLGISEPMRETFALLDRAASRESPVLVVGESGTGKDVLARALHRRSRRAQGPFVVLDCGVIARGPVESALLGHRKGALTDAGEERAGAFEEAAGGTLFIDELDELPQPLQLELLRALESGEVTRVGETSPRRIDARIVAATQRDLRELVDEGRFREDLHLRLAQLVIELPPLRERGPEEIAYLATNLLDEIMESERLSVRLAGDAVEALQRHSWPGNIRELRSTLEQAALRCAGGVITARDIAFGGMRTMSSYVDRLLALGSYDAAHDELDRWLIRRRVDEVGGDVGEAARRLGVGREEMVARMRALGMLALG